MWGVKNLQAVRTLSHPPSLENKHRWKRHNMIRNSHETCLTKKTKTWVSTFHLRNLKNKFCSEKTSFSFITPRKKVPQPNVLRLRHFVILPSYSTAHCAQENSGRGRREAHFQPRGDTTPGCLQAHDLKHNSNQTLYTNDKDISPSVKQPLPFTSKRAARETLTEERHRHAG